LCQHFTSIARNLSLIYGRLANLLNPELDSGEMGAQSNQRVGQLLSFFLQFFDSTFAKNLYIYIFFLTVITGNAVEKIPGQNLAS
jgi:hypothetical protein